MGWSFVRQEKVLQLLRLFKKILDESGRKRNKILVDKRSSTIVQWNQGSKLIIWKCIEHTTKKNMLLLKDLLEPVSKNVYIDELTGIVDKYNNAYQSTMKMKPVDVTKRTNQKEFRVEKVSKRKRNKLYIKWMRYDNSFNSWIDIVI